MIYNTPHTQTNKETKMKAYLTKLIEEKGKSLDAEIEIEGHYGLTYEMLVDFISSIPEYHETIRKTLVKIDFLNGDVFHYLKHLAKGMLASTGY